MSCECFLSGSLMPIDVSSQGEDWEGGDSRLVFIPIQELAALTKKLPL